MAKMFYSSDDVQKKLGISEDQLKQLVQKGSLREFRDGPKLMFKADEVDNLAVQSGAKPAADPAASDIDLMPLDDTKAGTGADIPLMPLEEETPPPKKANLDDQISLNEASGEIGLLDTGSSLGLMADDSAADRINLDEAGAKLGEAKDDTVLTEHGVDIIDESEEALEIADPLAQTQIAPDLADQVSLDSGSSGSGLLDLSREADDTSLGAELLDEIYPAAAEETPSESKIPTQLDVNVDSSTDEVGTATLEMPAQTLTLPEFAASQITIMDPNANTYGIVLLITTVFLVLLACMSASIIVNVRPEFISMLVSNFWIVVAAGAGATLLTWGIGTMLTNQAGKPKTAKPKVAKPKKEPEKKKKK